MNAPIRLALLLGLAVTAAARADEPRPARAPIHMRVGDTRTLGTFGAHRADCLTSVPPNDIAITAAPDLGTIVRRPNAPFVARDSLSGTCIGAHFLGTAIDFTARAPGTETIGLAIAFDNGQARRTYTIVIAP